MKTRTAAIGFLFAAVLLGASGPYTTRLSPLDTRAIKTVAVISALGNTFLFERVPAKNFEWLGPPNSHFLEISDWAIDPVVMRTVSAALAKRFTVKPIVFRPADFSTWDYSNLKSAALNLNGDPAIDAYVLILRDWRPDEIGYSVHWVGGLGFYRKDRPSGRPKLGVFASYRVVVVDALTGDTIASRAALLPGNALPWLPEDAALWPKTPNNLTDAQRATLAAAETKLIDATLLPTLSAMRLAH
ncbi:MAG TPA: hypothetical protein VMD53_12710 [Rhizomicrobium sp.]|nr:hypothetical protein [Rhizomicrobium sp.]